MAGAVLTDELWDRIDEIPGWLERDEAEFLLALCKSPWLEIGAHRGRSTRVLALTGPGTSIDNFDGPPDEPGEWMDEFVANTADLNCSLIVSDFRECHRQVGEIAFLYLDADHSYEATKRAYSLYEPKVVPGGVIALHDAVGGWWEGVERFYWDLRKSDLAHVGNVGRVAAFRK